jgi:outer membrane lipoprotein-sorting protein
MLKYFFISFFVFLLTSANATSNKKIIKRLEGTNNLNFKFEQNINGKIEKGNCTIEYPKKIFCKYSGNERKILVSNSRSLVIKTNSSYYRYPLAKTPLNFILDKNFLINKISNLKERIIDKAYINYTIIKNNNEVNIFFDNKTFDLIGWQMEDIYQNLNITFFSSIKRNQNIMKDLFKLPPQN